MELKVGLLTFWLFVLYSYHLARDFPSCRGITSEQLMFESGKVGEMESVKERLGESENQGLYLKQQLEDLREDVKTVLHVRSQFSLLLPLIIADGVCPFPLGFGTFLPKTSSDMYIGRTCAARSSKTKIESSKS